jgi:hypothetical protein
MMPAERPEPAVYRINETRDRDVLAAIPIDVEILDNGTSTVHEAGNVARAHRMAIPALNTIDAPLVDRP